MGLEEDEMSWSGLSERAPVLFGGAELELHHGPSVSTRQVADVGFVSRGFVSRGFVVPWLRGPVASWSEARLGVFAGVSTRLRPPPPTHWPPASGPHRHPLARRGFVTRLKVVTRFKDVRFRGPA